MKALQFNVNVPKFLIIQALRPISGSFCYRGPFSTVKLVDIPEPTLPSPEWVEDKNKTLRGLRQRHKPPFSEGFADRITLHVFSLRAGTRVLRRSRRNRQGS